MKKVAIVILAFVYLGLTTGVVKNLHYCMGELSTVDYGYDSNNACTKCGMEQEDGCCNTEFKVVKVDDSHQLSHWCFDKKLIALSLVENRPLVFPGSPYHPVAWAHYHHSPPDPRTNSIYLHTGVLLI